MIMKPLFCLVAFALALLTTLAGCVPAFADIPHQSERYRRDLTRIAQTEWGLEAPVATLAAQIHQESRWRFDARSPAGAQGLGQIMPTTATWLAGLFPELQNVEPNDPIWSMQAMVRYDHWLAERIHAVTTCEHAAMILAAYNGGLGWVIRDRRLAAAKGANPQVWFGSVERHNAGRALSAFTENRQYPRLILLRWEERYVAAGWGQGVCQ